MQQPMALKLADQIVIVSWEFFQMMHPLLEMAELKIILMISWSDLSDNCKSKLHLTVQLSNPVIQSPTQPLIQVKQQRQQQSDKFLGEHLLPMIQQLATAKYWSRSMSDGLIQLLQ